MRFPRIAVPMLATFVVALALAPTASADLGRVVVLGDSLAAGTRLGPQVPGSILACGRSTGSYPQLALGRVKKSAGVDVSCNGGHAGVFSNSWSGMPANPDQYQYNDGTTIPAQYNSLNGSEQIVIIGSGGNEAYFGASLYTCLGHSEDYNLNKCAQEFGPTGAGLLTRTQGSKTIMAGVLDAVHTRSPNAKIFLIGTPRIAPPDGAGCWPNPILTLADAPVWSVWEDSLRQAMSDIVSTRSSWARFVDVQAVSGNTHTACAAPSMKWMNNWTVENIQYPGLGNHNTPWGADAIADIVVNSIKADGFNTGTPNAPSLTRTTTTASPTQTFTYSGVAGHTFRCRIDNAAYAICPSNPVTLTGLSNGPHTYSVKQTDSSNNASPATIINFTVDTVAPLAPTVTRTSPTVSPTGSTTQTITYAGIESGGTFQCKLDGAAYTTCPASPLTLNSITTGTHTFYVTQTDAAGNVSPATSVTWTVDATPPNAPTVTRTSPSGNPTSSNTQVLTYSGAEGGGTFQCKLDSNPYAACTGSPVTLTGLGAGTHTYSVTQTDALGNVGSATTVTWTVDFTAPSAPTVARTSPVASPTNSSSQTITYSGAEPGGTFQCKLDSASFAACPASPLTLTSLPGGSRAYSVRQIDAAGNVGAAAAVSWTIDITPPPQPNVSGPSGTTAVNTATINYSNTEAGVTFNCKLDNAPYAACPPSPINLSGITNGTHTYYVTSTDAVGNTSSAGTTTWTFDPSGFTVSITANPSNPSTSSAASFSFVSTITSGTTYECKLDAGAFASCTSPRAYSGLGEGSHTFTVRAVNGSQTTPEVSRTWVVDTLPPGAPTLSRTSPVASPTNSTSQTLAFTAAEAGGVLNCKLDSLPASTCPSSPVTVTGLSNGSHTYTVTQTDAAGNTGSASAVTWVVDTAIPSAPTVTRTNPTAVLTNSTSQTITYGGLEVGATVQCKLDTGSYAPCSSSPLNFSGLAQGSHTLSVTQSDAAGNTSEPGSVSWTVDSIAPAAPTLTRESPTASPTNSNSQTLALTAAEAGGTLQCKLDNAAPAPCGSSPITLTNLSNGEHTYYATQTDATGNTSPVSSVTWTVDTIAPAAPLRDFNRPSVTNTTTATITYAATEPGGTIQCSKDSGAWFTCPASPIQLTDLADANHNYALRQVDDAGNIGAGIQVAWLVDTVAPDAPTVTRTSPASTPTNQTTATITIEPSEEAGTLQCKLDTSAWLNCTGTTIQLSNMSLGTHTYSVRQTDLATNISAVASVTWIVEPDTLAPAAPTVTRTTPTANPTSSTSQTITYSAAEPGGTLRCKLDAAIYTICTGSPVNLSGLANGSHTYSVTQTDSSGNLSAAGSVTWTVDNTPPGAPTVSRTSPSANPTTSTSQTLTYSGAEAGGTFQCSLDSATYVPCSISPVALTDLADGTHTYSVTQTDAAGNVGSAATVIWTIDATPPIAPVVERTSPSANPTNSTSQTITYSGEPGGTFQCKLDAAAYSACPSSPVNLTSLPNGTHNYSVRQTDGIGNVGAATTVTWSIDTTAPSAPTVSRTTPSSSPTNSTTQGISYGGLEAGATAECKLDGAAFAACASNPVSLSALASGTHTFTVRQTDAAGNVSDPAQVSWLVDLTPPPTPSVSGPSGTSGLRTATISYSAPESGVTFQCKLDSAAYAPCAASPVNLTDLPDGARTYYVTATDPAGNVSAAGTASWTVDPSGFTVSITSAPSSPSGVADASFAFVSTITAGTTYECKLDAGAYAACSSPKNYSALPDGSHTFAVRAVNGVQTTPETSRTWTIDTTAPIAPTVQRTSPTANPTGSTSQSITFSGSEAGGTFQCKLDAAGYAPCPSSPVSLNGLTGGPHTYSVTHTDSAGNVSAAGTASWTIDNTPPGAPTVTRTSPTANPTQSSTQTISYSGAEAGGTFQCKLDAAPYSACPSSPIVLNGLDDGTHTYSVTQTDAVGNVGSATTVTWTVDAAAPSAPDVLRASPTANPTNSTSQTITYSGEPGGTFQCKLDAAAYTACPSSPVYLTDLSNGSHSYLVRQTDALGNVGPATTVTWNVDTTAPSAPTVSRTSPTGTPTNSTSQVISYGGLDSGTTIECKLDGASIPCAPSPLTLSALSSGTHSYSVTQTDAAGNTSAPGSVSWVVDLAPPPTPTVSGPSGTSGLTTATISYSNAEAGVTFRCRLDAEAYSACPASPVNLTGLADGAHTYYVTATDAAGNVSSAGTATWTVDPSGFTASISSAPSSPSSSSSASFTFVATITSGTTYECKLDAGAYSSCSSPKSYSGLSDGSHTFTVRAVNGAQTSPGTSRTWDVDATAPAAPTIERSSPSVTPTNSSSQTLSFDGAEPGGVLSCKVNESEYLTCPSSPVTLTGLNDGVYEFSVRQTDSAGNVGAAATETWVVDTTPPATPTVARTSPTASITTSTTQTIAYSGEAGGTFECKFDGGTYVTCPASPMTLSDLALGSHIVTVRQTDSAGNHSPAASVAWSIETAPPEPTGPTGPQNPTVPIVPDNPPAPIQPTPISAKLSAVTPKSIVPAKSGKPFSLSKKRSAASVNVTLSKSATIRIRLERVVSGGATRASTSWTEFKLKAGRTTIRISGRDAKRALTAGRYRIHLKVNGANTATFSKSFKIKR